MIIDRSARCPFHSFSKLGACWRFKKINVKIFLCSFVESFLASHHTNYTYMQVMMLSWVSNHCWNPKIENYYLGRLEHLLYKQTTKAKVINTLRVSISTFAAEFVQPSACIKLYRPMQKTHLLEILPFPFPLLIQKYHVSM